MASSELGPVSLATDDALAGRRRRGRRRRFSRGRRLLRALEPFALLAGLGLLSAGVIQVVETGVPTNAAAKDARWLARIEATPHAPIEAVVPSLGEDRNPVVELLVVYNDPIPQLEGSPRPPVDQELDSGEGVDQLTTSISSTSNTSAAPPGILGGAPESP